MEQISTILPLIITGIAIPALAWLFRDARSDRAKNVERLVDLSSKAADHPNVLKLVEAEVKYEHERRSLGFKATNLLVFGIVGIALGAAITFVGYRALEMPLWWIPLTIGVAITVSGFILGLRDYARRGPTENLGKYEKKQIKTRKDLAGSRVSLIDLEMRLLDAKAVEEDCKLNLTRTANDSSPEQLTRVGDALIAATRNVKLLVEEVATAESKHKLNQAKVGLFQID